MSNDIITGIFIAFSIVMAVAIARVDSTDIQIVLACIFSVVTVIFAIGKLRGKSSSKH